jgi:hypothetical protein
MDEKLHLIPNFSQEAGGSQQCPADKHGQELFTEAGIAFPCGPCRRAGFTFEDAEAVISGSGGDDGEGDWAFDAYRQRRDREVERLLSWVDAHGLWMEPRTLGGARRSGMEHFILPLQDSEGTVKRLVKLTKGDSFGFLPICDDASYSPDDWFPPRSAV